MSDPQDDQLQPDSSLQDELSISTVADLQPNVIYCDSQAVFDSVNQARASSQLQAPSECAIRLISHSLSLRFLHYHGPFRSEIGQNRVLIANCVHDDSRNLLISMRAMLSNDENITFDDHINRTFTLKNFMTVRTNRYSFNSDDVDCHVFDKPLYDFFVVTSPHFHSTMKFYGNNFDDSFDTAFEGTDDETVIGDGNESNVSDISLSELRQIATSPQSLVTDDASYQSAVDHPEATASQTDDFRSALNNATTSSSGKRKQPEPDTPTNEHGHTDDSNQLPVQVIFNCENQVPNSQQYFSFPSQPHVVAAYSNSFHLLPHINEVLGELSEDIIQNYNVEDFIKANIPFIEDSTRELTKLTEVPYPSNKIQNYNFANVVGIIQRFNHFPGSKMELTISDEDTDNFRVLLGHWEIDQVKQNSKQEGNEVLFFSRPNREMNYPALGKGNLVFIRDLCLGTGSVNICAHPNQLVVVEPYKRNELALQNNSIAKDELRRLLELLTKSADLLIQNPWTYKMFNHDILDFCGQVIAKREVKQGNQKRCQLFLLLPYETSMPTYLADHVGYIADYIAQKAPSNKNVFTQQFVDLLSENNRLVMVTMYGNHAKWTETVACFQLVSLFNVHIKKDKFYDGFKQYIMHDGNDYGRRCLLIDADTILGDKILRSIDALIKEMTVQPNDVEEDARLQLDEETIVRYNGTSVATLLKELKQKQNSLFEETWGAIFEQRKTHPTLNRERAILKPYINVGITKRVDDFAQMVRELWNAEDAALSAYQQTVNQDINFDPLEDVYPLYFRVSARMVDYVYQDVNGLPINNMATFRANFVNFYCTDVKCPNMASFTVMGPMLSRMIASDGNRQLPCMNCTLGTMAPLFSLQLAIEDCHKVSLAILLTSPEAEELVGVTNRQLIFADPLNGDICKAVDFLLKSYCPHRRCVLSNNTQEKCPTQQPPPRLQGTSPEPNLNPCFDWIIQCVRVAENMSMSPKLYNPHLFEENPPNSFMQHLFYVRGIFESPLP